MGFNGILLGFIRIVRDFWVDIQQDGAPQLYKWVYKAL